MPEGDQISGPIMQDDPMPFGHFERPGESPEPGDLRLVAVFEDVTGADSCASDLRHRGLAREVLLLPRRGDGPEQGLRPGNVITGPGYGLSAKGESPPRNKDRLGTGVAVGASIGATIGLLTATQVFPGLMGGTLVTTLTGAGIGTFLGGLTEYGLHDRQDDATLYAGQVRRGGVLLVAQVDRAHAEEATRLVQLWSPLEIRVE